MKGLFPVFFMEPIFLSSEDDKVVTLKEVILYIQMSDLILLQSEVVLFSLSAAKYKRM